MSGLGHLLKNAVNKVSNNKLFYSEFIYIYMTYIFKYGASHRKISILPSKINLCDWHPLGILN